MSNETNTTPADDPRLTAFALGELHGEERAAFQATLRQEPELLKEVDALQKLGLLLETELAHDADGEGLGDAARAELEAAAEQAPAAEPAPAPATHEAPPAPAGKVIRWRPFVKFGVAAALLGTIGIAGTLNYKNSLNNAFNKGTAKIETDITESMDGGDLAQAEYAQSQFREAGPAPAEALDYGRRAGERERKATAAEQLRRIQAREQARREAQTGDLGVAHPDPTARPAPSLQISGDAPSHHDKPVPLAARRAASLPERYKERLKRYRQPMAESTGRSNRDGLSRRAASNPQGQPGASQPGLRGVRTDHPRDTFGMVDRKDGSPERVRVGYDYERSQRRTTIDTPFKSVDDHPLSTFSIDVDTASYSTVRKYLKRHTLPPIDAVRVEELVNYFPYDYDAPGVEAEHPFAVQTEVASCPWAPGQQLVRVALKGKVIDNAQRPTSNLVFLLDVSGSMGSPGKLPLLKKSLHMLVDQLGENDRVAIVVYAGASGLALPSTPASDKERILSSLDRLRAGGSTNGGAGIQLAYNVAVENFIEGGTNRVILCTDGDFNVGVSRKNQLTDLIQRKAKSGVFLSILGFGMNHSDRRMEALADKGNGHYAFIDTQKEAHKVLVEEIGGTLVAIAKDVKIQVEFNPLHVESYRLIGYANRQLKNRDFADDTKDAGDIGAGHTVTAFYQVVPRKAAQEQPEGDLKYQRRDKQLKPAADSDELMTVKLRYKQPEGQQSTLLSTPVKSSKTRFWDASQDFRFAASVAAFGMILRDSPHKASASFAFVEEAAQDSLGHDSKGYRAEFLNLVKRARSLSR